MTIEEMLQKRAFNVEIASGLQDTFTKELAGIDYLEDIKDLTNEEIREYIYKELDKFNRKILILPGYLFTKNLYHKMYDYYEFELHSDSDIYVMLFLESPMMIVAKGEDVYADILHKLTPGQIKYSNLNIKSTVETDDSLEITYYTHINLKFFETAPKAIEDIIKL